MLCEHWPRSQRGQCWRYLNLQTTLPSIDLKLHRQDQSLRTDGQNNKSMPHISRYVCVGGWNTFFNGGGHEIYFSTVATIETSLAPFRHASYTGLPLICHMLSLFLLKSRPVFFNSCEALLHDTCLFIVYYIYFNHAQFQIYFMQCFYSPICIASKNKCKI